MYFFTYLNSWLVCFDSSLGSQIVSTHGKFTPDSRQQCLGDETVEHDGQHQRIDVEQHEVSEEEYKVFCRVSPKSKAAFGNVANPMDANRCRVG